MKHKSILVLSSLFATILILNGCFLANTENSFHLAGVDDSAIALDVNNDGKTDLLQPKKTDGIVHLSSGIQFGERALNWKPVAVSQAGELLLGGSLFIKDIDEDGQLDALVRIGLKSQIWYGGEGYRDAYILPGGCAFVDVNGDGLPDIVNRGKLDRRKRVILEVRFCEDLEKLRFKDAQIMERVPALLNFSMLDLDDDGLPELVARTKKGYQVYRNDWESDQGFTKVGQPKTMPGELTGWLSTDKGKSYRPCAWHKKGEFRILAFTKQLVVEETQIMKVPTRPMSISVGNLNGDKHPDLAILPSLAGNDETTPPADAPQYNGCLIFHGQDDGSFKDAGQIAVRAAASTVLVAQFNGKGLDDLGFTGYDERFTVKRSEAF